jgi:hypothetical protein
VRIAAKHLLQTPNPNPASDSEIACALPRSIESSDGPPHNSIQEKISVDGSLAARSLPETLHPISGIICFAVKELNYLPA